MSFDGNFQEPVKGQFTFFLIQLASTFITAIFFVLERKVQMQAFALEEERIFQKVWKAQLLSTQKELKNLMYKVQETREELWRHLSKREGLPQLFKALPPEDQARFRDLEDQA